jgi:hypothetical protein
MEAAPVDTVGRRIGIGYSQGALNEGKGSVQLTSSLR